MRIVVKSFLAVLTIGSFFGAANAGIISVNLQGNDEAGLPSTDSVGVVSAANWNNVAGASGGPVTLNYSTGLASPVTISSFSLSGSYSKAVGTGTAHATPQETVFQSGLNVNYGTAAVSFAGLSAFTSYDILVYYQDGTSFPESRQAKITNSGDSPTTFYAAGWASALTGYKLSDSTDSATYKTGNYARFTNLTGDTQTISYIFVSSPSTLAGFQIITAVPEPASLSLLTIGGVALLGRRRNVG